MLVRTLQQMLMSFGVCLMPRLVYKFFIPNPRMSVSDVKDEVIVLGAREDCVILKEPSSEERCVLMPDVLLQMDEQLSTSSPTTAAARIAAWT